MVEEEGLRASNNNPNQIILQATLILVEEGEEYEVEL